MPPNELPPYSPEHNPDEHLNGDLKRDIDKKPCRTQKRSWRIILDLFSSATNLDPTVPGLALDIVLLLMPFNEQHISLHPGLGQFQTQCLVLLF